VVLPPARELEPNPAVRERLNRLDQAVGHA
jgi:hypothetical protein